MITVCDWAGLSIGQHSTPSSLRSCSRPAKRAGDTSITTALCSRDADIAVRQPAEFPAVRDADDQRLGDGAAGLGQASNIISES